MIFQQRRGSLISTTSISWKSSFRMWEVYKVEITYCGLFIHFELFLKLVSNIYGPALIFPNKIVSNFLWLILYWIQQKKKTFTHLYCSFYITYWNIEMYKKYNLLTYWIIQTVFEHLFQFAMYSNLFGWKCVFFWHKSNSFVSLLPHDHFVPEKLQTVSFFENITITSCVKVTITDLHRNLPCSNPDQCQAIGSELRFVVSTFITLIQ